MTLRNALASVAVKDVNSHRAWYAQLLGSEGRMPMLEASPTGFSRVWSSGWRSGHSSPPKRLSWRTS